MSSRIRYYIVIALAFVLTMAGSTLYSQCPPPTLVQVTESKPDSITLTWFFFNDNEGWELELVPLGSSPTLQPTTPIVLDQTYTFGGLTPASAYTVFIRTVCSEGVYSEWNPVSIRTQIPQPSPCLFTLPLKNNNCNQGLEGFEILVEGTEGLLGDDLFLSSVDLIIEHTWPADLDIRLESPTGREITLSQNNGTVTDNYGDISDLNCDNYTRLSDLACVSIGDVAPPFIGSYLPETPIFEIEDGSTADGVWKLKVCDRSSQDIGDLKFVNLNFEPLLCEIPRDILVKSIDATTVEVVWTSFEGCSGTEIDLSFAGDAPGSINTTIINCEEGSIIINDLLPGTEYEIYVLSNCGGIKSPLSCAFNFITACTDVTDAETFDQNELCVPGCSFDCDVNGHWFNVAEDDQDWLTWDQRTDTDNTGPRNGVFGGGNYIYVESSPDICQPKSTAILQSTCFEIFSNEDECDFSFWYYMFGEDIGNLSLLAYANEAEIADTIFSINGDQGDVWQNVILSLKVYDNQAVSFRFVATTGDGPRSDIAIDQIEFRGSIARPEGILYYQDVDLDGYGNLAFPVNLCSTQPSPIFVSNSNDCDDNNENINPESEEIPCNDIDENCNGSEDDNPIGEPITYEIQTINDNCSQKETGSISLTINTGNPPYSFLWNTTDTSQNLQNIGAGSYNCIITDDTGCAIQTDLITIVEESNIGIMLVDITMATCDGKQDGRIAVSGQNGLAPYSYIWLEAEEISAETIENIPAGSYHVIAIDADGCSSDTLLVDVLAEGMIEGDVSFQLDVRCYGDDNGILRVDAISGTAPFSYLWDRGDDTALIENLVAGSYQCTITDAVGCQAVIEAQVFEPDSLASSIVSQENINCFGENTGSIKTNILGGTAPYTFAWSTGQQTDDIFDLTAGEYHLTITDANACTTISNLVTLTEPEQLSIALDSALAAKCILSEDGYLGVEATGGIEEYSYFWSTSEQDTSVLENISPGIYSLTITDQNNCKATFSNYELVANSLPIDINITIDQQNICADDSIAVLIAHIDQGQSPIDYNWSAGVNNITSLLSDSLTMLPPGSYALSVTDAVGCLGISDTIILESVAPIQFAISERIDNVCYDDTNGLISIVASEGVAPYSYKWNTGETTNLIENLRTGKYTATIIDQNECQIETQNISVNSLPPFEIFPSITNATGTNTDGSLSILVEGGSPPYTILWQDEIADENELTAQNLSAGEYMISISDEMDCDTTITLTVDMTNSTIESHPISIEVYPNPVSSMLYIVSEAKIENIEVLRIDGRSIDHILYNNSQNIALNTKTYPTGLYILKINTESGPLSKIVNKI